MFQHNQTKRRNAMMFQGMNKRPAVKPKSFFHGTSNTLERIELSIHGGHEKKFEDGESLYKGLQHSVFRSKHHKNAEDTQKLIKLVLVFFGALAFLYSFSAVFTHSSASSAVPKPKADDSQLTKDVENVVHAMTDAAKHRRFIKMEDILLESLEKYCFDYTTFSLTHSSQETFHLHIGDAIRALADMKTSNLPPNAALNNEGSLVDASIVGSETCPLLTQVSGEMHGFHHYDFHSKKIDVTSNLLFKVTGNSFYDAFRVRHEIEKYSFDPELNSRGKVQMEIGKITEKYCSEIWDSMSEKSRYHLMNNVLNHAQSIMKHKRHRGPNAVKHYYVKQANGHIFRMHNTHHSKHRDSNCPTLDHILNWPHDDQ